MFKGIVHPASKKCMDETLFQHRNCFLQPVFLSIRFLEMGQQRLLFT